MLTTLSDVDVLVIGAGPTGLGAAKRLQQLVWQFVPRGLGIRKAYTANRTLEQSVVAHC